MTWKDSGTKKIVFYLGNRQDYVSPPTPKPHYCVRVVPRTVRPTRTLRPDLVYSVLRPRRHGPRPSGRSSPTGPTTIHSSRSGTRVPSAVVGISESGSADSRSSNNTVAFERTTSDFETFVESPDQPVSGVL